MTHIDIGRTSTDPSYLVRRPFRAILDRFHGPGGFYNAGNLLGLSVALATQFFVGATTTATSFADRLYAYFAGSPSSVALTLATTIFLFSGETYHRAWAGRPVPSARLNRIADLLAAGGATLLTASLLFTAQVPLALASGILIVGGKLGSAATCDDRSRVPGWPAQWSDPFRTAVLAGRAPGLIAVALDLGTHLAGASGGVTLVSLISPATLIVCYALWIKADLMLVRSRPEKPEAAR